MENNNELHNYITASYARWVDCATYYIRRSKLPIDAPDVVNDVLCGLLERETEELERINSRSQSELDLLIRHIIKISIYSPRSPFRYNRHLQRRACSLNENMIETHSDGEDEVSVEDILRGTHATELEKKIFVWVAVEGKRIAGWEGTEGKRRLYRAYSRVLKKIIGKK